MSTIIYELVETISLNPLFASPSRATEKPNKFIIHLENELIFATFDR